MKGVKLVLSRVLLAVMIVVQVFGTTNISKVQAATSKNLESVIVSGGTFDTGIKINQNYSAELTFSLSALNQYKNLYVAAGSKYNVYRMRYEANSGLFAAHGWYNQKVYVPKVNEEVTIANKKNVIYVNGSKVLTETYQSIDAVSNLQFGDFKGSIKSFRVWNESNTLIASYIPVLDENSKACMYDTVNKKYVYYSGTCQAGKVVVDDTPTIPDVSDQTETEKTDSTETSGTEEKNNTDSDASIQYAEALEVNSGSFDTGILINQDYSIEMTFSLADTTQYKDLYSATNSQYNVYKLRSEAANGLYATHGWYRSKIYTPEANEEIKISQKKNVTYINGKQVLKMTYQQLQATNTLKFGNFKGTIKSFSVWNASGKLVGEYLPAVDESGKACMYDTVNKKYVYYSGTCKAIVVEEEEVEEEEEIIEEEDNSFDSALDNGFVEDTVKDNDTLFKEELLEMLTTGDTTSHNIAKYGYNDWQKVSTLYNEVINNEGLVAYNSCFNMYYSTTKNSSGVIQTIKLENIDSGYVKRYESMKKIVDDLVEQSAGMTEVEKVVLAHDYVAANCQYAKTGNLAYTAAGALVDKKAICSGYARAMIVLLKSMGVEAEYINSQALSHAWVKVKVNGNWYHADPTWANTRSSVSGQVTHTFLLRTDAEYLNASSNRHYGWDGTVSTDQSFTNWNVHDIIGQLKPENGSWYYIDYKNGQKTEVNINK